MCLGGGGGGANDVLCTCTVRYACCLTWLVLLLQGSATNSVCWILYHGLSPPHTPPHTHTRARARARSVSTSSCWSVHADACDDCCHMNTLQAYGNVEYVALAKIRDMIRELDPYHLMFGTIACGETWYWTEEGSGLGMDVMMKEGMVCCILSSMYCRCCQLGFGGYVPRSCWLPVSMHHGDDAPLSLSLFLSLSLSLSLSWRRCSRCVWANSSTVGLLSKCCSVTYWHP